MVDELARRLGVAVDGRECDALVGEAAGEAAGEARPLLLAKPQTYMNRSGFAARCLAERRELAPVDLLVVYDEVALPLGRVRVRPGGGPAGHRGIESVIAELRTDEVARVRLGIAPEEPPADLVGFVLAPFAAGEEEAAAEMVARAADACQAWLAEGVAAAMNRFNGLS